MEMNNGGSFQNYLCGQQQTLRIQPSLTIRLSKNDPAGWIVLNIDLILYWQW